MADCSDILVACHEDMIDVLLKAEAQRENIKLPIFVHGYDYPWPDGRPLSR